MKRILSALVCVLACTPDPAPSDGTAESGSSEDTGTSVGGDGDGDGDGDAIPSDAIWLDIDMTAPLVEVDPRFLSYALDTDKVVHQQFDFDRPRLLTLTQQLSPALLRIGGTKADIVYYDLSDMPVGEAPLNYGDVLTKTIWDAACDFASDLGVEMLFTVNAGAGPRDVDGLWLDEQARQLLEYSVARACPVEVWEFGNEVGSFNLEHGFTLTGTEYAADFETFAALVEELDPSGRTAGPAAIYWPIEGEVIIPIIPDFVANAGEVLDILTWHFYPQQSSSCPVGSRYINQPVPPMFWLDAIEGWADEVEGYRDAGAPQAEVWMGETGHALCGGEPGISDTFASNFWWLDELGRLARRGQAIVVRQALSGGAYKLIEDSDLEPTPDYYASLLWKRHMGERVLTTALAQPPESLRAYAHCDVAGGGSVVALVINFDESSPRNVALLDGNVAFEALLVTASEITATSILVNGELWQADADGNAPTPAAVSAAGYLQLPPLSYAFVRMPDVAAPACM